MSYEISAGGNTKTVNDDDVTEEIRRLQAEGVQVDSVRRTGVPIEEVSGGAAVVDTDGEQPDLPGIGALPTATGGDESI